MSQSPPGVRVWVEGDRIRVGNTPFAMKDVCKSIPGYRWEPNGRYWHYPATPEVAGEVITRFGGTILATQQFLVLAAKAREAQEARLKRDAVDLPPVQGEIVPSWLHQVQAHHFIVNQDAAMLAVGMGGGKSKSTIDALEAWGCKQVLIICPANVLKVWPKEFAGDPDAIPTPKVGHQHRPWRVLNGLRRNRNNKLVALSLRERRALLNEAWDEATDQEPLAFCVNYEAAPQSPLKEALLERQWDAVVLDESHRIKSPGGVQSKFCDTLRTRARKRLCLTGTPLPHSPLDIYAQYRFLDPGVFGTSYARFRQKYAVMGGFQGKQVLGMNDYTLPELHERMAKLAYIISNEELDEVLGLLPPVWPNTITVELGAESRRAYDDMANNLVARVQEGVVSVNNALTQLLRLQQITSGYLPIEAVCGRCEGEGCERCDGLGFEEKVVRIGTEKQDALADWMADLQPTVWSGTAFQSSVVQPGEPLLVACRFRHDLDSVREVALKQGRRYGELSGRDNAGLTDNALMHPDVDVLGVQIQAGGVGIDLTRAHYVANFSVGFSLGDWLQWLKRTHRPGQNHRVVYQNFACPGTVDVTVLRALLEREAVVKAVIQGAKESGRL